MNSISSLMFIPAVSVSIKFKCLTEDNEYCKYLVHILNNLEVIRKIV